MNQNIIQLCVLNVTSLNDHMTHTPCIWRCRGMEFFAPPMISMTSTKEGLLDYCCLAFAGKQRTSYVLKRVNGVFEN